MKAAAWSLAWLLCVSSGVTWAQAAFPDATGSVPYLRALNAWKAGHSYRPKILNGLDTFLSTRPWQVALVITENNDNVTALFCGATAVQPRWVVTAAHCVDKMSVSQFRILYGIDNLSNLGSRVEIERVVIGKGFVRETLDNDIALVELKEEIAPSAFALLLERASEPTALTSGNEVTISGWGNTYDWGIRAVQLQSAAIKVVKAATCRHAESLGEQLRDSMFCAGTPDGSKDACQGDSGGPATVELAGEVRLTGVISGGEGCGQSKKYGTYSRVAPHAQWIREVMGIK